MIHSGVAIERTYHEANALPWKIEIKKILLLLRYVKVFWHGVFSLQHVVTRGNRSAIIENNFPLLIKCHKLRSSVVQINLQSRTFLRWWNFNNCEICGLHIYIYTEGNFLLLMNFNDREICGSNIIYKWKFFAVNEISITANFSLGI